MLHPCLQLAGQLVGALKAIGKHDRRLDGEATNGIGHAGDSALAHRLVLEQLAFDLEGPDAVARRLDDVVVSADVPEVAVLVDPSGVARVVPAVVNRVRRLFGVAIVFHHDARGTRLHADAYLTGLAGVAA